MNEKVDYLIVGQGLAGSFLAFQLLQQNKSVLVIDQGLSYSSSYIAAGIINPMVLRRYTKSWRAEEFLKYNTSYYQEVEKNLGKKYHFQLPIKKLISSKDEEEFWHIRLNKEDLSSFIDKDLLAADHFPAIKHHFKVGNVKQTSWLNISEFLSDFRSYLNKNACLLEEEFDYNQLQESSYKNISFEKIIFCEGARATKNPYFPTKAFSLNKGQLMTIKSNQIKSSDIIKKKVFLLPISKNEYKVGATYSWKWNSENIEKEKSQQLKEMFLEMFDVDYEIVKESAGVRPAVKDRRPLMGKHPEKDLFFFNGMGSKGCLMAPLLVKEFCEFLLNDKSLSAEVNIQRYF